MYFSILNFLFNISVFSLNLVDVWKNSAQEDFLVLNNIFFFCWVVGFIYVLF